VICILKPPSEALRASAVATTRKFGALRKGEVSAR